MPNYNITVDISPLAEALSHANVTLRAHIAHVVSTTAKMIEDDWKKQVGNATGVRIAEKTAYIDSIKSHPISPFEIEVWSDYQIAAEIETGRPARDLKKMLDTSTRVRISAKGVKYLIIPMRHNAPGSDAHGPAMPPAVYAQAKQLSKSSITGQRMERNAHGRLVPRNTYQWGQGNNDPMARLKSGLSPKLQPHHKSDPYAGMVRMKSEGKGSQYLTFRVMTSNSNGWIVPAKPGLFIVQKLVDHYRPQFEASMSEAISSSMST